MTCWALLAVKPPHLGKSRLASVLSGAQRERLIRVMLARVLDALDAAEEIDQIAVVTPATELLPRGVIALDDPGGGLNHALGAGRRALIARGADEVLVLHADLPSLSASEIDSFVRQGRHTGLALAPDRHGHGTNAVFLAGDGDFSFRFGTSSFTRHMDEAAARAREATVINLPGFAMDIDEPADLQHFLGTEGSLLESALGTEGSLLESPLTPRSSTRWTPRPQNFSLLYAAEHG